MGQEVTIIVAVILIASFFLVEVLTDDITSKKERKEHESIWVSLDECEEISEEDLVFNLYIQGSGYVSVKLNADAIDQIKVQREKE